MPPEESKAGKWEETLGVCIDPNAGKRDAGEKIAVDADAALQEVKIAAVNEDSKLHAGKSAVDTAPQKNMMAGQQKDEESTSGPSVEVKLADEIETAKVVLLCVAGTIENYRWFILSYLLNSGLGFSDPFQLMKKVIH